MNVEFDVLREVLGFDPETSMYYNPEPFDTIDLQLEHKTTRKRIESFEDMDKWERELYIPPSKDELIRRWISAGLSEQDANSRLISRIEERQQLREIYRDCETIFARAYFGAYLDRQTECRLLTPNMDCNSDDIEYTTHNMGIRNLLSLAPMNEAQLLEIVNRFNDARYPAFGSSGTLQLVADYLVKPIIATSGESVQEFMPRIS